MTDANPAIVQIEQIIDRPFANKLFGAEALQMIGPIAAVRINGTVHFLQKNVDLAIRGDAMLAAVLCKIWDEHRDNQGRSLSPTHWTTIRNEMLGNANLARIGFKLGVDVCILAAPFTACSGKMVATTVEAVIGAVCRDAGDDAFDAVRAIVEHVGLNNHPLLMVTYCGPPLLAFPNIQMITNVPLPSSLTWPTPGDSTRRAPWWLAGRGLGLFRKMVENTPKLPGMLIHPLRPGAWAEQAI